MHHSPRSAWHIISDRNHDKSLIDFLIPCKSARTPTMDLYPRQSDVDPDNLPDGYVMDDDGVARPWSHSKVHHPTPRASPPSPSTTPANTLQTGYIIKWSVIAALILVVGLYLLLSYLHAQRRLRKGLTPRKYHRVSRLPFGRPPGSGLAGVSRSDI